MKAKGRQSTAKLTTPQQATGQQRTYVYSPEALSVLEKAKDSGYKLNDFVSEAIIEYGKQQLDSTEGITLKQQVMNLERVVASIGIKQIQSLVREKKIEKKQLDGILEYINDCPVSPYDADLKGMCKKYALSEGMFASKEESHFWWILFYAVQNKLKVA